MKLFELLKTSQDEKIIGNIIFVKEKAIGLIKPSVIEGEHEGQIVVNGPAGIMKLDKNSPECAWSALLQTKSILFGELSSINKCNQYLTDDHYSRTASFLMASLKNCEEFIRTMERLESLRILVIGCGGIGSLTAMNLLASGVKNLTISDGDVIEKSNLNRQFFWNKNDIGRKKVDVFLEAAHARYDNIRCNVIARILTESEAVSLARENDLVILTADEPLGFAAKPLRKLAEDGFIHLLIGGYIHNMGTCSYIFGKSADITPPCSPTHWMRTPNFIGPSSGPLNTEIASIISLMALDSIAKGNLRSEALEVMWGAFDFPRRAHIS